MHRIRIVAAAAALAAGIILFAFPHARALAQQSCGETTFGREGTVYRVLFAKNGAVQQFVLVQTARNVEQDHDVLKELEAKYGQAGVNAPPLQIVSFRPGSGGMMIPDKAIDSCGRTSYFSR